MLNTSIVYVCGMESEIFKKIQFLDKVFEVSNHGTLLVKDGSRARKLHKNSSGYLCLTEKRIYLLHRIVATAFCENSDPINKKIVNHKDGNKLNNFASNLEWVTHSENNLHSIHVLGNKCDGAAVRKYYENHGIGKKIIIYKDGFEKEFNSGVEAAKYLNVTSASISSALNGRTLTSMGYKVKLSLINKVTTYKK